VAASGTRPAGAAGRKLKQVEIERSEGKVHFSLPEEDFNQLCNPRPEAEELQMYTVRELAAFARLSPGMIQKQIHEKKLKVRHFGTSVRIPMAEAQRFLLGKKK